jgi:homoserine dehydrogenase
MVRLALLGHGPVARAFVRLVAERGPELERRHGVPLQLAGIRTASQEVLLAGDEVPPRAAWEPAGELKSFLRATRATVLVQAIPSSAPLTAEAMTQALAAFEAGMDLVTATKSHLVADWATLRDAAVAAGRRIRISAATGAALPAADLARISLRGFAVEAILGTLNGTSSFVLDRMAEGSSLEAAVARAQELGIAEADPTNDLDGHDAATKITLLANLLWDVGARLEAVSREPISAGAAARAARCAKEGRRLRAVAIAERSGTLRVSLEELEPDDPLFGVTGPEKAVAFDCGEAGSIMVTGGRSSPRGAAHALLKDLLDLVLSGSPGFD